MLGADGIGEAACPLIRSGEKSAFPFYFEMLSSDGADLIQAEPVQFGHDVMVWRVRPGEMRPIYKSPMLRIGRIDSSSGLRFLVMAIP